MMKGNINLISYDCYQQATEKQLAGLKWKENRVYYISEIHNEKMQDEIYGYIDDRCRRLSLSTVVNDIYRFDLLKEFLNEKCTSCSSITDKKWEELERSYKAFLYKKGLALYVRRNRPDRRNVEQQSSAQISFLKMYYEYVVKCKTADLFPDICFCCIGIGCGFTQFFNSSHNCCVLSIWFKSVCTLLSIELLKSSIACF